MTQEEYFLGFTPARWRAGQAIIGNAARLLGRLHVHGAERLPREGGLVIAVNHFSWFDPPGVGAAIQRRVYFMAKSEVHRVPGLRQLIRYFGTFSVRRGQSDRDAVRLMREVVRRGEALGLFVEGTRQRSGVPGVALPGAAMVALQERVPVLPVAIRGSFRWKPFQRVDVAFGELLRFDDVPANGKGYKEATQVIEREIHRLWDWLGEQPPRGTTPPPRP
jgi:1-acyl-sn-glycerol-3-phosphate acyltransferase